MYDYDLKFMMNCEVISKYEFKYDVQRFSEWKRQSYGQVWNRAWRPSPWVIVSGISTNGRGPNKPRRLTLVSALKTRAVAGKGPFEALARGGRGTAIHGWWCQLPVARKRVSPRL